MMKNDDETYMLRCIQLAKLGSGNVAPNPLVGCVIVYDNKIIGEGYHQQYGQAHAEVNAINSVVNKEWLKHSTLYVNLEPCAHYGKTPPCANYIIKHQLKKVVIGCVDIFSKVNGAGIKMLEESGIDVNVGLLERGCINLNKRFFTFHAKKRPFITLKWAQSINNIIGDNNHPNLEISNKLSKCLSHKMRSVEQAILVGSTTVITDNPSLTTRLVYGRNPKRIIIDLTNKIPSNKLILIDDNYTYIFSNCTESSTEKKRFIKIANSGNLLNEIMNKLYVEGIQSVIIEGGSYTLQSFIELGLWDEAMVFVSEKKMKGNVFAPIIESAFFVEEKNIGSKEMVANKLLKYKNVNSFYSG